MIGVLDVAVVLLNVAWTWLILAWNVNGAVRLPIDFRLERTVSSGWMWGVLNVELRRNDWMFGR